MADGALYAAVILAVLSAISALAYAITQVLHAWRAVKSLRRNALREVDRLVELADKAEHAADSTLLQTKLARLRVTLARFAVLRQALDEVSGTVGRATAVYPRK